MALRTTFEQLVEMTLDECRSSSATSRGNDFRSYVQRVIKRVYETLCDDFDWTFLRVDRDQATKELEAGERYYDFPIPMDLRTTTVAWTFYGNIWVPLQYGIDEGDYNSMNPELNQRADPQLKWNIKNERQFEVWPMPATDGNLVRFHGRKLPEALVSDTARADMDDQLIALYASAEILAGRNQKDADIKLAAAQKRKNDMRRLYSDRRKVRIGMGTSSELNQAGWPRIRAFPAQN